MILRLYRRPRTRYIVNVCGDACRVSERSVCWRGAAAVRGVVIPAPLLSESFYISHCFRFVVGVNGVQWVVDVWVFCSLMYSLNIVLFCQLEKRREETRKQESLTCTHNTCVRVHTHTHTHTHTHMYTHIHICDLIFMQSK